MARLARRARRVERELGESEARYRALIEHAPDAIVVIDADTQRFIQVNENATRLFKLSEERLLELGPAIELSPPVQPDGQRSSEAALKYLTQAVNGEAPVFEWTFRASDGGDIPCEVRLVRLPSAGRVLIRASFTEMRERKEREQERARAAAEREFAERAHNLQRITDAALAHNTLDELLPELVARLRDVLNADDAAILLAESNGDLVARASEGLEEVGTRVPVGVGFAGRVAATGRPVELRGHELEIVYTPELRGLRSLVGVPLTVEGQVVGVVQIGFLSDRSLSVDEVSLLELASDRAALGIENARVYERERMTAQSLQRSLLPGELPEIPGVELAASYHPAGEGLEVGGDFYDVFPAGKSRWIFVVGDVCGKGPEAAAVTAQARYSLHSEALHDPTPSTMLERLNTALLSHRTDRRYLTVVCAALDLNRNSPTLTLAVGGHPPPLHLRADTSAREAGQAGPLVGLWDEIALSDTEVELEAGDTLVFYTDGLLDAHAPAKFFDSTDLADALTRDSSLEPADLVKRLEATFLQQVSSPPRDDVAILAVRFGAHAAAGAPRADLGYRKSVAAD